MAVSPEDIQQIVLRLSFLENSNNEKNERIRSLQEKILKLENFIAFSKKNGAETKDQVRRNEMANNELRGRVDALERENKALREQTNMSINILRSYIQTVASEAKTLEENNIPNIHERLRIQEEKTRTLEENKIPNIHERLRIQEEKTRGLEEQQQTGPELNEKLCAMIEKSKKLEDVDKKVEKMSEQCIRKLEWNNTCWRTKAEDLDKRMSLFEKRRSDVAHSVTRVSVNTSEPLVTHEWRKLDHCCRMGSLGGIWDEASDCLRPRVDGRYVVGMTYGQTSDGVISMRLEWEGESDMDQGIGLTRNDGDVTCGMTVVRLKAGQKVWLKARVYKGDARITWCGLYCWLV